MKIMIDIGHPAHVHYFRNFIKIMENKGHKFFITARDKEVAHVLLNYYGINYVSRGKGSKGLIGKIFYTIIADIIIYKHARKFKPDLFLSFSSAYAAHVSKLLGKPHIAFDDTEHAKFEHLLYVPFTDAILTPSCFSKKLSKKQIYFDGYMELCYLYPKYLQKNETGWEILKLQKKEKYIIIRFVSWGASHDHGQFGFKASTKLELIKFLEKDYRIFISSESELPDGLDRYKLEIPPFKFHDVLSDAILYIGEGATTASESSVLGISNVYVNSLIVGYCKEQGDKYNICYHFRNDSGVISKVKELLSDPNMNIDSKEKGRKILKDKIDVTAFMVWFVENYPDSFNIMKKNPDYQYNFK